MVAGNLLYDRIEAELALREGGQKVMNVFILSREISVIRFFQEIVREAAGETDVSFFLEWDTARIREVHQRTPIDLLIWQVTEEKGISEKRLRYLENEGNETEILFVFGRLTQEWVEVMQRHARQNFLLEPLNKDGAAGVVRSLVEKTKKKKRLKELERRSGVWKTHEKMIRQQFWDRFLNGKISPDPIDIVKEGVSCGVNVSLNDRFHLAMLSRQMVKPRNRQTEGETRKKLIRAVTEFFGERDVDYELAEALRPFLIIKNLPEDDLIELLEDFVAYIGEKEQIPLCCYYDVSVFCENVYSSAKAIAATEKEDVPDTPGIYRMTPNPAALPSTAPMIPKHAEELLRNGQVLQFRQLIQSTIQEQFHRGEVSGRYLKMIKMDVQQMVHVHLKERDLPGHLVMIPEEQQEINENAHISIESFLAWLELYCRLIPKEESHKSVVALVKHYAAEHIREDITREKLAEQFYMNADYLGKLFKRETGESLGYFLMMEKLKEAKRLLLATDKTVGEICAELGYENFSYFSRIFGKYIGCTPREYRKQNLQEKNDEAGTESVSGRDP